MSEILRVPVSVARQKVLDGRALLVCAYEDELKFKRVRLDGAISLSDFQSRLGALNPDQEIIFYCA